ncbi:MAG: hypothetical protein VKJ02_13880 [Snowella sp.]|nr:hypothetical protein [Snowella sp.]
MTVKDILFQRLESLLPEEQESVLEFIDFLYFKRSSTKPKEITKKALQRPRKDIRGLCADLNLNITEEDIKEVRQEMWQGFPREIE